MKHRTEILRRSVSWLSALPVRCRGAESFAGVFSLLVGLYGAIAWLAASPTLVDAMPGTPLVFGCALGLLLCGLALLWPRYQLPRADLGRNSIAVLLVIGGLLIQAQHLLGLDFGIDLSALHRRVGSAPIADSFEPGRVPWTVGLAFLCAGVTLLLIAPHSPRRLISLAEMASIAPGLIGALGLLAYMLAHDDAYVNVYSRQPPMSVLAAAALLVLSLGLWAAVARKRAYALHEAAPEEDRIVRAAALVMIPVVVVAGFGGFDASRNLAEHTMRDGLLHSLNQDAQHVQMLIHEQFARVALTAARPEIVEALDDTKRSQDARMAQEALVREVYALLNTGFAAVHFETPTGSVRASGGVSAAPQGFVAVLSQAPDAQLLWSDGFRLRVRMPVTHRDKLIGYVVTEQTLPYLTGLALGINATDETTEVLLAYREGDVIYNFPSRFSSVSRTVPATTRSLAVFHAVTGRTGLLKTRDYRDREVVAAFTQIGDTGLGMVVKIDVAEFYAPITRQFRLWVVLLALGVIGALFVLRRLIRPLAVKLVRSESAARRISVLLQDKADALKDSEARIRAILDGTGEAVLTLRDDRCIDSVNPAVQRIFGYAPAQLLGRPVGTLIRTDDDPFTSELGTSCVGYARRADEKTIAVEMTLDRVNAAGRASWVVIARDISQRREQERVLRETHARLEQGLATLFERNHEMATLSRMSRALQACATPDELCQTITRFGGQLFPKEAGTLHLLTDERLMPFSNWNGGVQLSERDDACSIRGLCSASAGCNVRENLVCARLGHPSDATEATLCIPVTAQDENLGILTVQLDAGTDEEVFDARRHLAIAVGEHVGLALANLRLRDTLRNQSIRDPLTGLYNRRYLEEAYRQAEANARRKNESLVLVMIDLDYFKRLNDNFGHEAGDVVLQAFGALLKASVREGDTACRFGGEEFALLLPGATLEDGIARAESLRREVERLQLTHAGGALDHLTASFGVAGYPAAGTELRQLILAADEALYVAKDAGRNCVIAADRYSRPRKIECAE
ncbi:MAG TPA: diguanylate cyclase [Burkholderiales bacterium]